MKVILGKTPLWTLTGVLEWWTGSTEASSETGNQYDSDELYHANQDLHWCYTAVEISLVLVNPSSPLARTTTGQHKKKNPKPNHSQPSNSSSVAHLLSETLKEKSLHKHDADLQWWLYMDPSTPHIPSHQCIPVIPERLFALSYKPPHRCIWDHTNL